MKQRYEELTEELCFTAVKDCFAKKWTRNDVSCVIEEYAGVSRRQIKTEILNGGTKLKTEAIKNIGYEIFNRLNRLMAGDEAALDLDEVQFRYVPDGMNGKIRKIAYCCIFHQIFGHLVILGLKPLLKAKILPSQFASIPNKGQTGLKNFVMRKLRKNKLNIRYGKKTDVVHAYESTKYEIVIKIIEKEIPSAHWIIKLLTALAKMSPEGCLIIGGYSDAWLFNFLMSYVLRHAKEQHKEKRGKKTYLIAEIVSFMDDFGYFGSREADVKRDITAVNKFLATAELRLKHGNETQFLSIKEEKKRRKEHRPSKRACPYIDIGGYQMHHGYVTIRKKIFIRRRRQFLRAAKECEETKTICLKRAYAIVSGYGYFVNSNSKMIRKKLNVDFLHTVARHVVSFFAKLKNQKLKEAKS